MDFGKVQQQRKQEHARRQIVTGTAIVCALILALTFVPQFQSRKLQKVNTANADTVLQLIRSGKLSEVWSGWFRSSLRQQHELKAFESEIRRVVERKGTFDSWNLRVYESKPQGKPYEFLSYDVHFARGVGTVDFALEPEDGRHRIRAYRINALGL